MNYRHAFHAGNFADVHKHVALLALIERLKRKPTPLFFLDTHAGRGAYDLQSADSTRASEWVTGIGRLRGVNPVAEDLRWYWQATGIAGVPATHPLQHYPGSPLLALQALRDGDRAVFIEQQEPEMRALEQELPRRRNVSVVCGDGYAALKGYLPPKENRGLVLIDPPYESENEFAAVERALRFGLGRWPNGMFAVWYPIKASAESQRFLTALQNSGLRKLLRLELLIRPADSPLGLNGSGLIVANPPWQWDVEMRATTDELQRLLSADESGRATVDWLVKE
ncbi:MAG TPA: 23S rRNA (adenine(2030)-N(6))-methyltransferase RlmJ [Steroidobacteraceae bacterium]|jgi:23S rRNA (adenine2030-N6)-methyltransferase